MQVVVQSCRGTEGSQGTFRPFFDEQNDGEDTVKWIEGQPWFTGDLALWGISYLGNTAWAVANSGVRDQVKAIGFHVTLTNFRDRTYAFDGFTLLSCIGWTATMLGIFRNSGMNALRAMLGARKTRALTEQAIGAVPLRKADRVLTPKVFSGGRIGWITPNPTTPGGTRSIMARRPRAIPPTVMTAGWHDIFLPWQLKDFMAAQRAGRDVRIIIGPWMHASARRDGGIHAPEHRLVSGAIRHWIA